MTALKKYLPAFFIPWLVYLPLLMIVTMGGGNKTFLINIVLNIIFFGLMTFWFRKKSITSKERLIKTILIATPIIFFLVICFFKPSQFITAPNTMIAQLIGIILGLVYESLNKQIYKLLVVVLPILIGLWVHLYGADIWQHYIIYNTFRSGVTLKEAPQMEFKKDSVIYTNDTFRNKITVLFLWNTSCTYIVKYFPKLIEKQTKWSENSDIEFYTVNFPVKSDTAGSAEIVLKRYNVNITNLTGPPVEESYKTFGSFTFPLAIILSPEGKIIFWGSIDKIDNSLQRRTKK